MDYAMRVYVSYAMSGSPDLSLSRGERLASELRDAYPDYEFVVPHEIPLSEDGKSHVNPTFSHGEYIRKDIEFGLKDCDAIALTEGWTRSTGCLAEFYYAMLSGHDAFLVQEQDGTHQTELISLW
jgi:hypothetical protein